MAMCLMYFDRLAGHIVDGKREILRTSMDYLHLARSGYIATTIQTTITTTS